MFTYSPLKPNASVLIFDLDDTLLDFARLYNSTTVTMPTAKNNYVFTQNELDKTLHAERFPKHCITFLNDTKDCLIYLRPYLLEFLTFCFDHFNVAFWSNGEQTHVKHVVLQILRYLKKSPKDIAFAWGSLNEMKNTKPKFIDVFTKKVLHYTKLQVLTYTDHKDMEYVFHTFPKRDKTDFILFDNMPNFFIHNLPNIAYIPPFTRYNIYDCILHMLICKMKAYFKPQFDAYKKAHSTTKEPTSKNSKKKSKKELQHTKKQLPKLVDTQKDTTTEKDEFKLQLRLPIKELKWLEKESPTCNNTIYPNGEINFPYKKIYTCNNSVFKKNENVIVPVNDSYVIAKIKAVQEKHIQVYYTEEKKTYKDGGKEVNKKMKHTLTVPICKAIHHSFEYAYI